MRKYFDLLDKHGHTDHGKMMGFVFFWTIVTFKAFGVSFSLGELMILGSMIYGARMFMAFLRSRTVTSAESILLDGIRKPTHNDLAD